MIYLGKRFLKESVVGEAFILEATALKLHDKPDQMENAESYFSKVKGSTPLMIGALYEMEGELSDDGMRAVKLAVHSRKGLWDDELDPKLYASVTRWKINDAATREEMKSQGALKKLQADKKAMREIQYLREVYHGTPILYRRGFETGLMALIRLKK